MNADTLLVGDTCPPSGLDLWILAGQRIDSCLGEKMKQECKLQIAVPVLVIVIVCNLIKLITILLLIFKYPLRPLATTGDAVLSFLERPDSTTEGMCDYVFD